MDLGNTQPHYKQGPLQSPRPDHFISKSHQHPWIISTVSIAHIIIALRRWTNNFLLDKTWLICSSSAFIQLSIHPIPDSRRLKYISDGFKKGSTQKLSPPFSGRFAFNVLVINEWYLVQMNTRKPMLMLMFTRQIFRHTKNQLENLKKYWQPNHFLVSSFVRRIKELDRTIIFRNVFLLLATWHWICICICTWIWICTHNCIWICTWTWTWICTHICICIWGSDRTMFFPNFLLLPATWHCFLSFVLCCTSPTFFTLGFALPYFPH